MLVKDIMRTSVVDVQPESTIWDAIRLMLAQKVSGLPVVDRHGALLGILSEGDLLRRVELGTGRDETRWYAQLLASRSHEAQAFTAANARKVGDVMSRDPVTVDEEARLSEAVALMERHHVKRLPVVRAGRLVGIVTRADFLRALAPFLAPAYEEPATNDREIERAVRAELQRQHWAEGSAITVTAENGQVRLEGTVTLAAQRDAARVLAEGINGVTSVVDRLVWVEPVIPVPL